MGINLFVKKVIGKTTEELWNGKTVPFYETEALETFDSIRHSGDREFVVENEFVFMDDQNPVEEQELARPKDFAKCREWVKNTRYPEGNKNRLLGALDMLENDESLVFKWSW